MLQRTGKTIWQVRVLFIPAVFLFTLAAFAGAVQAEESDKDNGLKITFSPYGWGTSMNGKNTLDRRQTDIDLSFSDILDNLNLAAMFDFRVEKGRWAVNWNLVWADLEGESNVGALKADIEPTLTIFEMNGHYRLTNHWEVLGGIRYYELDIDIDFSGAATFSLSGDEKWIDPLVGVVFSYPLSDSWSFGARGDIGGLGSDLSWQLWALFDCRFGKSKRHSLVFGWRHLDFDYDRSGPIPFAIDAYLTGPIIGARFRF
jgi:hypothetical protein